MKDLRAKHTFLRLLESTMILLRATEGARNPNLQVVITHASHVCSQQSFELPLKMNGMHRTQFGQARFGLSTARYLIKGVLTVKTSVCQVKLKQSSQSTVLEQKRLDLRSLSPTLPNLWLLRV